MATAKEFIERVSEVPGVDGCVLVREDGEILGGTFEDPDLYTSLMILGGTSACGLMEKVGSSHCSYLSFHRKGKQNFNLFPIGQFYLGLIQTPVCNAPAMLQAVLHLIGRVTTGSSAAEE